MTKRITLRHLEAFRAVILCKTVTSAAEMLHVSQPVVTRLVADLEDRIGFALFDRQRGRLIPTSEAHALYEEVHRSLIGVDRILHIADEIRGLKGGSLQIAAAPAMALSFMPKAISSFVETHPGARITLHMHSSGTVVNMVQGGRCDVGFAMLSMRSKGTYGELLLSTKMVCAISTSHRLHEHAIIHPTDLEGERFISHPQLLETRLQIDSIFATHGVSRQLNIETQTSYALMQFVEAGAGIAIIDPLTAACYRGNSLRFIPFEPTIATDFSLLTSSQHAPSMLLKPFIKHVRKVLHQEIDPSLIIHH